MKTTPEEEAHAACDMILTGLVRLSLMSGNPVKVDRARGLLSEWELECNNRTSHGDGIENEDYMMSKVFRLIHEFLNCQHPRRKGFNDCRTNHVATSSHRPTHRIQLLIPIPRSSE